MAGASLRGLCGPSCSTPRRDRRPRPIAADRRLQGTGWGDCAFTTRTGCSEGRLDMRYRSLTWVATLVLTTVSLVALAPSAGATAPGADGRILFLRSARGCGKCIVTIDPDGTDPVRIDAEAANWSPDGARLASYAILDDGRVATMLMDPDGSNRVVFPIDDPTLNTPCTIWAPDGSRLFCEVWDDVHPRRDLPGVFSIDASDGSDLTRITTNSLGGHDIVLDSSPDGRSLVFVREDPGRSHRNFALMRVDVDGSNLEQIGPWIAERWCCTASWSPDGSTILTSYKGSIWAV